MPGPRASRVKKPRMSMPHACSSCCSKEAGKAPRLHPPKIMHEHASAGEPCCTLHAHLLARCTASLTKQVKSPRRPHRLSNALCQIGKRPFIPPPPHSPGKSEKEALSFFGDSQGFALAAVSLVKPFETILVPALQLAHWTCPLRYRIRSSALPLHPRP